MAKYLGGIKDPDISIDEITRERLFADFLIKFHDHQNKNTEAQYYSVFDHLLRYEEISSKRVNEIDLDWAAIGYVFGGILGGLYGATHGGVNQYKHIMLCELANGWQFAVELSDSELQSWESYRETRAKGGEYSEN